MTSSQQANQPPAHPKGRTPGVSYIMPVLNEEQYLADAVGTILEQHFAGPQEIILALGPSTDATNEIAARLAAADSRVTLVHNPGADIPLGLNLALEACSHEIIIRVDAHSELTPDYTERGVATLRELGVVNVGGIMRARGTTPMQRAIARGYNSPFGLGGGTYHSDGEPGPAESAYLGIFDRSAVLNVGGYDPGIRRGEDWELNLRLRRAGHTIWFDPALQVTYWPRQSLPQLARQFFATGVWRAVLVRRYGRANPWRFFVPGALVVGLSLSVLVAVLQLSGALPPLLSAWASLVYVLPALYLLGIGVGVATMPEQRGWRDRVRSAAVLVTMHLSWGAGFLTGIVRGGGNSVDTSRLRPKDTV